MSAMSAVSAGTRGQAVAVMANAWRRAWDGGDPLAVLEDALDDQRGEHSSVDAHSFSHRSLESGEVHHDGLAILVSGHHCRIDGGFRPSDESRHELCLALLERIPVALQELRLAQPDLIHDAPLDDSAPESTPDGAR